jgi:hypothetical protein
MENQSGNKQNETQEDINQMLRTINCLNLQNDNLNYLWMASHM